MTAGLQEDWNDEATLDTYPYHLSKKLAEKIAWELSSEYRCALRLDAAWLQLRLASDVAVCRFDLVSINPVMMLGPVVSAYGSSNSIMEMKLALEGNEFKTLSNKVSRPDVPFTLATTQTALKS